MDNNFRSAGDRPQSIEERLTRRAKRLHVVTDCDRRFFERNSDRNYRIRPAARIEIEHEEIVAGSPFAERRGMRWFTLVKRLAPGMRGRMVLALPKTTEDISEWECQRIFEQALEEIRERGRG